MAKSEPTKPPSTGEPTRRVQLSLPECKAFAEMLLADVAETLGLPDVDARGNEEKPLTIAALRDAAPKIKRLLKLVDDTETLEQETPPAKPPAKPPKSGGNGQGSS